MKCDICENEIIGKTKRAKYCSDLCKQKEYRKRRKKVRDLKQRNAPTGTKQKVVSATFDIEVSKPPRTLESVTLNELERKKKIIEEIRKIHGKRVKGYEYDSSKSKNISLRRYWHKEARRMAQELGPEILAKFKLMKHAKVHKYFVKGLCETRIYLKPLVFKENKIEPVDKIYSVWDYGSIDKMFEAYFNDKREKYL